VRAVRLASLSELFDPFLRHFMEETVRSGGEVTVAEAEGQVVGVLLCSEVEHIASVFARDPWLVDALARRHERLAVFSELPLEPGAEVYHIYGSHPAQGVGPVSFRHPVRAARDGDRVALTRLLTEVYGTVDERWLDPVEREGEKCFVVELDHVAVGAAWLSVVGRHGRLHSLSVRPGYRRLGIGTDLWKARMVWARHTGVTRVLTEISEHNLPSRAIAEAGGMRPVGAVYLSGPRDGARRL
jgi:GNAT superfamily N-acetyltransferase